MIINPSLLKLYRLLLIYKTTSCEEGVFSLSAYVSLQLGWLGFILDFTENWPLNLAQREHCERCIRLMVSKNASCKTESQILRVKYGVFILKCSHVVVLNHCSRTNSHISSICEYCPNRKKDGHMYLGINPTCH